MLKQKNASYKGKTIMRLLIVSFFVVVLIIGLCIYDDYGISIDEPVQRVHSLVNYEYINEKLFGREIPYIQNLDYPSLEEYEYNFYNMATQVPMVAIEDATGFSMAEHNIFEMRHLYTFLVYFASLIFFFFLLKDLLKKEWLALVGTAMLYLFPRFFAESFYNVKDLMFVAVFIIALFCLIRVLKSKRKIKWCILFSVACAFAANTRTIGVMLLPALLVFMLVEDILGNTTRDPKLRKELLQPAVKGKVIWLKRLLPYIVLCLGVILCYIAITPASWHDPATYIKSTFLTFSDYNKWDGTWLFAGSKITLATRPWYYIPVWMGITIPLFYWVMFGFGAVLLVYRSIRKGVQGIVNNRHMILIFILFLAPLLAGMIFQIKIYIGWKHVYFLFVPFLIIAVYGLGLLQEKMQASKTKFGRSIVPVITAAALVVGAGRIIVNHPYQNSMFNAIGVPIADQFDRDYWELTHRDMIVYLLDTNEGPVKINAGIFLSVPYTLLTPEQRERVIFVDNSQIDTADYIVYSFREDFGNDYRVPGFTEIYSIWQDGYKIGTILKNDGRS